MTIVAKVISAFVLVILVLVFFLLVVEGIERQRAPVLAFRKTHACPATQKFTGPCPGFVVDHIYPLCAGGADAPENMQWQEYKQSLTKDRLEVELCRCRGGNK